MSTLFDGKKKFRIGVLRGGPSHSYEASLQTGSRVLSTLRKLYEPVDILISRDGVWHINGKEKGPDKILPQLDFAFVALHGNFGEDGKIQTILERYGTPYNGSRPMPSALAMNKIYVQKYMGDRGFRMPTSTAISHKEHTVRQVSELFRIFPQPSIIKPALGSTSVGISVARNFQEFQKGIERAMRYGPQVIVEEYIPGIEVSCVVFDKHDKKSAYALPIVEIKRPQGISHHEYEMKCDPQSLVCTSEHGLSPDLASRVQDIALDIHRELGLRHYSSSDFIVSPERGIYLLEVNSLPPLALHSPFEKSIARAGISMDDFLDHIMSLSKEGI